MDATHNLTALLAGLTEPHGPDLGDVMPLVYDRMRAMAERQLQAERADHTLQPTALVHEAYLRLAAIRHHRWAGRAHFFGAVSTIIRRVLIEYARQRQRLKRSAPQGRITTDVSRFATAPPNLDLLALDEALRELARLDRRKSEVVELRVFGRLTMSEIADLLGVSRRIVYYDWRMATAWLSRQIGKGD